MLFWSILKGNMNRLLFNCLGQRLIWVKLQPRISHDRKHGYRDISGFLDTIDSKSIISIFLWSLKSPWNFKRRITMCLNAQFFWVLQGPSILISRMRHVHHVTYQTRLDQAFHNKRASSFHLILKQEKIKLWAPEAAMWLLLEKSFSTAHLARPESLNGWLPSVLDWILMKQY